jgi:hypothetical protein
MIDDNDNRNLSTHKNFQRLPTLCKINEIYTAINIQRVIFVQICSSNHHRVVLTYIKDDKVFHFKLFV